MNDVKKTMPAKPECSFCGKKQAEVSKLIAGPEVYICDECVGLCQDILIDEKTELTNVDKWKRLVALITAHVKVESAKAAKAACDLRIDKLERRTKEWIDQNRKTSEENAQRQWQHNDIIEGYLKGFNELLAKPNGIDRPTDDQLLEQLTKVSDSGDIEADHIAADRFTWTTLASLGYRRTADYLFSRTFWYS